MRARRIWLSGVMAVLAVAVTAVGVARSAQPSTPTGDIAIIESYTIQAAGGHLLVGPYSRFQWHHPGPIYFYALAPFYLASHRDAIGLNAAAVAINVSMIVVAILVAASAGGPVFAVAVGAAAAILALRADELLSSAWNPHVVVLPMFVAALSAAAAAAGQFWFLPLAAFAASFAAETHIGTLPVCVVLGGASALAVVSASTARTGGSRVWKPLAATLLVVVALWLPTLVQQFSRAPGNITALWNFFSGQAEGAQSFHASFIAWSSMLAGVARPDFQLARGLPLRVAHSSASQAWAIGEMALLALMAVASFRKGRRFELWLSGLLLAASLVALWSVSHVFGGVIDHEIFWIAALGALNAAAIVAWLVRAAAPRTENLTLAASGICALLVVACAFGGLSDLARLRARSLSDPAQANPIVHAAAAVGAYLREQDVKRPFVDIDQKSWSLAAGVLLQLQKSGAGYAVDDDWLPMFTDTAKATGQERLVLSIAGAERHVTIAGQPGVVPVFEGAPVYVDAYGPSSKR